MNDPCPSTPENDTCVVDETTPAPETPAPETAAPETAAPETAVPETATPETAAPETAVPETATPDPAAPEAPAPEAAPASDTYTVGTTAQAAAPDPAAGGTEPTGAAFASATASTVASATAFQPSSASHHLENTRRNFSFLGFAIVLLTGGMTLAQIGTQYLLLWLFPGAATAWWSNWVLSFAPLYGVGLPLMYIMLNKVPVAPHNPTYCKDLVTLEKPAFTAKQWFLLLVMSLGCMYTGSMIGNGIMGALEFVTGYPYSNGLESIVDGSPLWITFLCTCILAPLGEEFIFRKLFIDRARGYGDTIAILFSGLLFGLFHGNLYQFFYAAMLGIILAYIYTRTGNIWWCVIMHSAVNLVGGIIVPTLSEYVPTEFSSSLDFIGMVAFLMLTSAIYGLIALSFVLFFRRRRKAALSPAPDMRAFRYILRDAFVNPGMMVAVSILITTILATILLPLL